MIFPVPQRQKSVDWLQMGYLSHGGDYVTDGAKGNWFSVFLHGYKFFFIHSVPEQLWGLTQTPTLWTVGVGVGVGE